MAVPYLTGELRGRFDRWIEAAVARHMPPLTFPEVRKGVRAVSSLYVERRGGGRLGTRSTDGRGKRAALASYFAPLHFLTVHHAFAPLGRGAAGTTRVLDLGSGTGASGAAVATTVADTPALVGVDRSGWTLSEARWTWLAFGLHGRARRGGLLGALSRAKRSDLCVLGWVVNELGAEERSRVLDAAAEAVGRGARMLVVEPLAGAVTPWWPTWRDTLKAVGMTEHMLRLEIELPEWIRALDRASGLDHRRLGARVLWGETP